MRSPVNLGTHALSAAWLGLTVYLFLVSEPRSIRWGILGPIGVGVVYFAVQWARYRRTRRAEFERGDDRDGRS
jgi:hypothetical protein